MWGEVEESASAAGIAVITMVGRRPGNADTWMSADAVEAGTRIDTVFPDLAASDLYVCGPSEWSQLVIRDARAAGVPSRQIHVEGFFSAQRGKGQARVSALAGARR